jgi:hypothetical protein
MLFVNSPSANTREPVRTDHLFGQLEADEGFGISASGQIAGSFGPIPHAFLHIPDRVNF